MNTIAIETETRPVAEWLPKEDSDEIVYLTKEGRTRFVIVPLDEGDAEAFAVQRNARLMPTAQRRQPAHHKDEKPSTTSTPASPAAAASCLLSD